MNRKNLRVLALSDFHSRTETLTKIKAIISSDKFDLAVISGDLTNKGPLIAAKKILEGLLEQLPVLAVPGNMDPPELQTLLKELNVNLHGQRVIVKDVGFVGAGADVGIGSLLSNAASNIRKHVKTLIFITHYPPYGTEADLAWEGLHIGSPEIREAVEKYQPDAILCGHVHESRGTGILNRTIVCNPGPVYKGFYAKVNVTDKVEVQLSQI